MKAKTRAKKFTAILASLAMAVALLPFATVTVGANSDFVITNGVLEEYIGNGGAVVIPDGVRIIGTGAFRGNDSITSVVIPDGVAAINTRAFASCNSLTEVVIPASVRSMNGGNTIGVDAQRGYILNYESAFANCASLEKVTFLSSPPNFNPANATFYISRPDGFQGCDKLEVIYVPYGTSEAYRNAGFPTGRMLSALNIVEICTVCLQEECECAAAFLPGRILDNDSEPTIFDALEILKFLVGMDGVIKSGGVDSREWSAALITDESKVRGEPSIFDVLEVLKYLVGMESLVDS
ncbi:MAG: leucine-rich repeat domain-containing protein [Oscillospiraceae bacterium]|nr:leucine-rich repeat domain-containing protein [Oscillospiraceae bacterium]